MRPIFETCEPRDEVLRGELKDEIFAARLKDVIDERAEEVYQKPAVFFENTYPTEGLKTLCDEVLGRLLGAKPVRSPFIRLETAFGGGKTHNLIALYHLVKNRVDPSQVATIIKEDLLPEEPLEWVAGVVGSDLDPENGIDHGDATTYTLWGEIAYQLKGIDGYRIVESSDQNRVAPGTQVMEKLVGDEPVLILIDEIARHLRAAKAMKLGDTNLAEQTIAFLMSLIEFVASRERAVLVLTLADPSDAFGRETEEMTKDLAEAKHISARQERVITPTGETEIAAIVTHRLLKKIDKEAAKETADHYSQYYRRLLDQDAELPERAVRADYTQEMVTDYPFHPEFLTTLNRKTSTIRNFQKTRGALRLLAMVVRRLWEEQPLDACLIHPHHLDLGVDDIVDDLTSRLERPEYRSVVEADIVSPRAGSKAHAQELDLSFISAGKPPYTQRVATAAFLHSLTHGVASGVHPEDLLLAVIHPDDEPTLIIKATEQLYEKGWFFDYDGTRYRFKPEPSINKIIADEMNLVGRTKAKQELDDRIRKVWKKKHFKPEYFPSEAGDVDDDAKEPKLVVIHYDAATVDGSAQEPPELVLKIFERAGTLEGYRTYKNNLLFLVADQSQVNRMVELVQRYLAIQRIVGDSERLAEFNDAQRDQLKKKREAAELDVRVAITRTYKYLYYPSADAPKSAGNLAVNTLPPQDQGEVQEDQVEVILRVLKNLEKVLTADDAAMPAAFVKAKAWSAGLEVVSTESLRKAFAQRMGLKMLLDINQLKRTTRDGAKSGVWVYYDAVEQKGYGPPSPAPMVRFDEDALLYTPEEAERLGIQIKGEDKPRPVCPLCDRYPCVCDEETEGPVEIRIHAEGAPAQVFQSIADQCHDQGVEALKRLTIRTEGPGKEAATDARAMGLAIPQMGKGTYFVEQSMGAEFGAEETFEIKFSGYWDRYKRVKQLTDAFSQEASKVHIKTTLRADFPQGLPVGEDQFQTIRDVFTTLNLGKMFVNAEPIEKETGGSA